MARAIFAFKEHFVDQLQANIETNLGHYVRAVEPWVHEYGDKDSLNFPTPYRLAGRLVLKHDPKGSEARQDLDNAIRLHQTLRLNRVDAADARIWTRLSHIEFWPYMRARWPVNAGQIDLIRNRYFVVGGGSRSLVRQGISRLWWLAELTHDESRANPYELTEVMFRDLDLVAQLSERNYGRSSHVMKTVLEFLQMNRDVLLTGGTDNRRRLRQLAIHLNNVGGVSVLDILGRDALIEILQEKLDQLTQQAQAS